jgi:hypothetical protein
MLQESRTFRARLHLPVPKFNVRFTVSAARLGLETAGPAAANATRTSRFGDETAALATHLFSNERLHRLEIARERTMQTASPKRGERTRETEKPELTKQYSEIGLAAVAAAAPYVAPERADKEKGCDRWEIVDPRFETAC